MATTNTAVVTALYSSIAGGQTIPSADLSVYTALLNSSAWTTDQVTTAIEASGFVQNVVNVVIREYQAAFGRVPDQAGLNYWVGVIAPNGPTGAYNTAALANLNTVFASADEFNTRYGTTGAGVTASTVLTPANGSALVTALYTNVLGRAPDAAGLNYWLNAHVTLSQLLQSFATANEFVALAAPSITAFQTAESTGTAPTSGSLLALAPPTITAVLTTGVDTLPGTSGADNYVALIGPDGQTDAANTLNSLDSINGGSGIDSLTINDQDTGTGAAFNVLAGIKVANIENITLNAAVIGTIDTTGISGVSTLTITGTADTQLEAHAGSTTAVVANGVTGQGGFIDIEGGSTQTVTADGGMDLSGATGAITVTGNLGSFNDIDITDGTTVKVTTTVTDDQSGNIQIGSVGDLPSGAVTVVNNVVTAVADSNSSAGDIEIEGGSTVSVTQVASGVLATVNSSNSELEQANVSVDGEGKTTTVTVVQTAGVDSTDTAIGVTAVQETATVKFGTLKAGDSVQIAGYKITAVADMTAAQVATDFAGLSSNVLSNYTSGAASGDTVVFTDITHGGANVADLNPLLTNGSTHSGAITTTVVQGVAGVTAAAGVNEVDVGFVDISDSGTTNTIATVSLTNFDGADIQSDALTSLTLVNGSPATTSGGFATGDITVTDTKATTLDLTVNGGADGFGNLDLHGAAYTSLKAHLQADSAFGVLNAANLQTLTIDGTGVLKFVGANTLTALTTVTATGAAGLSATLNTATLTDINLAGTSGNNTVVFGANTTAATYEGGTGKDSVTIVAAPTHTLSGGAGADTLTVNIAGGFNASTNAFISGFETLGLGALATGTYDATGFTALTHGGITNADVVFSNVAAGTTLALTAFQTHNTTYTLADATGASDSLSLSLKATGNGAFGTVTAAGIETVTISDTDSTTPAPTAGSGAHSLTLVDTAATSVTITGNTTLTLTATGDVALTSVDASAMTGGLTYTTAGTVAETVHGGAAANHLTAFVAGTTADVLIGGAGNDVLTANAGLDTLTGGGGSDTFVSATAGANVNSYATITDGAAGDLVQLKHLGTETFNSTKVTLASTAVFQDYANASVATVGGDHSANAAITWFQYGGDTYVVEILHNATTTATFVNGTDIIVKLAGLHDLTDSFLTGAAAPTLVLHG